MNVQVFASFASRVFIVSQSKQIIGFFDEFRAFLSNSARNDDVPAFRQLC